MENQIELIKTLRKITLFNDLLISDLYEWLGYTKYQLYQLARNEIVLPEEDIKRIKDKINKFEETGVFKLIDRPRQKIDYELLHQIENDYMGPFDPKMYDDPRLKHVLYYEDVE